jgi:AcrR family transcriptional regulator
MPTTPRSAAARARILEAARRRFARHGYAGTTIRAVAADARIDASLVMRYYGSKEGLFAAAAQTDLELPDLSRIARDEWADRLLRNFFERWDGPRGNEQELLLRSATTNAQAAERLRAVVSDQFATALDKAGADQPRRRAALVTSQLLGIALLRYVIAVAPLADAPPDEVIRDVAPTLRRYLTGSLTGSA